MNRRKPHPTFWQLLDRVPPVGVRVLARTGSRKSTRPLTSLEICRASGLSLEDVRELSEKTSWDTVPLGVIRVFCSACNVDLGSRRGMLRHLRYIYGSPKWSYLRRSGEWDYYLRLIDIWRRANQPHKQSDR